MLLRTASRLPVTSGGGEPLDSVQHGLEGLVDPAPIPRRPLSSSHSPVFFLRTIQNTAR